MAAWNKNSQPDKEIAFTPAASSFRISPASPASSISPPCVTPCSNSAVTRPDQSLQPVELVIDHSVQVDEFGTSSAFDMNALLEFQRNKERYSSSAGAQTGFRNLAIVPPDTGIVHQVNLEYLARVVFVQEQTGQDANGRPTAYPDTLVGTDSHTT